MNIFTENRDFYPTPKELVRKLVGGIDFDTIIHILEPSAGSGNIVNELEEIRRETISRRDVKFDIDCIEIDENLRHILKGNGKKVVHNDFLTYNTYKEYDLIVMNPPFSQGVKHLLKALEMQERNGGEVRCILNAESLRNLCTNERKDLFNRLMRYNADITYLTETFADADRQTNVEIALIKVKLPTVDIKSFIFEQAKLRKAMEVRECPEYEETQLIEGDFIKATISQYELEVEAGINLIKEYYAMQPLLACNFGKNESGEITQEGGCILSLDMAYNRGNYSNCLSINEYIRQVRCKYWTALFNNPAFTDKLTSNLVNMYRNKVAELANYDFSFYNICEIRQDMINNMIRGVEDTIIALFDEFSHKHYYYDETSQNIHYYNGWKTNKAWYINDKVIIPLSGFRDLCYSWGGFKPTDYKVINKLADIEKCFNYLDKGLTSDVSLRVVLENAERRGVSKKIFTKYFELTFYKKGTCHIRFLNKDLLKKFNIYGSQKKAWLPPSYGSKSYEDMTEEEKEVIDAFEGEAEYKRTCLNKDYFLVKNEDLLLLETQEVS